MRRKERMTSLPRAWEIFDEAEFAILSMCEDQKPYAVPLSMIRIDTTLYFHCAMQGRKSRILQNNPAVCVQAVSYCEPDIPGFSIFYASVWMQGKAVLVQDMEEKAQALKVICETYVPQDEEAEDHYIENMADHTAVWRVDVEEICGKERAK